MRKGLLKDYANALCGVGTGWQMEDHLELLRAHRLGRLELDVLRGSSYIDGIPERIPGLGILRSWLLDRANRDGLAEDAIENVTVTVAFDCEERTEAGVPQWRFHDFRCQSQVSAGGRAATGGLHKTEVGIYDAWTKSWTFYEGQPVEAALKNFPELRQRLATARDLST
ncbi:MAG TPA: hypothetical protein VLB29_01355 [Nocardioidaceae bacterium]|nr:hypothetical protein [Nocardioidaceae bacterium]